MSLLSRLARLGSMAVLLALLAGCSVTGTAVFLGDGAVSVDLTIVEDYQATLSCPSLARVEGLQVTWANGPAPGTVICTVRGVVANPHRTFADIGWGGVVWTRKVGAYWVLEVFSPNDSSTGTPQALDQVDVTLKFPDGIGHVSGGALEGSSVRFAQSHFTPYGLTIVTEAPPAPDLFPAALLGSVIAGGVVGAVGWRRRPTELAEEGEGVVGSGSDSAPPTGEPAVSSPVDADPDVPLEDPSVWARPAD